MWIGTASENRRRDRGRGDQWQRPVPVSANALFSGTKV